MKLIIYCDDEKDIPDQVAHVNIDGLQKVMEVVIAHLQDTLGLTLHDAETRIHGARFCPECRALLEENSVYCDVCGTDTPRS